MCLPFIDSQLSRCSTARGHSSELSLVGSTKVKAHKSFLLTVGSLKVENKQHLVYFVVKLFIIYSCLGLFFSIM